MNYKLFGKSGLRVSELCLGAMMFGGEEGQSRANYETSKEIFDFYTNLGGNFIDTANIYTQGSSELLIGEFIHQERDHFVLATKFTMQDKMGDPNYSGNQRKNLRRSLESSLKRLKTDYIDILWLHAWDFLTPIEEIMRTLDDLISAGKVNYIGICNTPAWIISQANTIAEFKNWNSFCGLQTKYNLIERSAERELIPMAKAFNLAVTPWAPLEAGILTGKYINDKEGRLKDRSEVFTPRSEKISKALVKLAKDLGVSPGQIALNWLRQKDYTNIPIVGVRTKEQIKDNMACLNFGLEPKQIEHLDEISKIDLGYPHDMLQREVVRNNIYGGTQNQIDF